MEQWDAAVPRTAQPYAANVNAAPADVTSANAAPADAAGANAAAADAVDAASAPANAIIVIDDEDDDQNVIILDAVEVMEDEAKSLFHCAFLCYRNLFYSFNYDNIDD